MEVLVLDKWKESSCFFKKISSMYLVKSDLFHIDNVSKYSKNFEKYKF